MLDRLFRRLRVQLCAPSNRKIFQTAQTRHTLLQAFPDIETTLQALEETNSEQYALRDSLVRVMLQERELSKNSFWMGALIVAFAPMLMRLRATLRSRDFQRAELDLLVVEEFIEALVVCNLEARFVCGVLRQNTSRNVWRVLTRRQRETARAKVLKASPDDIELQPINPQECAELEALLREWVGEYLPKARLDIVVETLVWGIPVRAWVEHSAKGLTGKALETAYDRVRRERHRTLERLRTLLTRRLPVLYEGEVFFQPMLAMAS